MKQEDLKIGQVIFIAVFVPHPNTEQDVLVVRRYVVEKLGKKFFSFSGERMGLRGMYTAHRDTYQLIALSQEGAVENLEIAINRHVRTARAVASRAEREFKERTEAIDEWRKKGR